MKEEVKKEYSSPLFELYKTTLGLNLLSNASPGAELSGEVDGLHNDTSNALDGHTIRD